MNSRAERNGTQIKRLIDQIRELYALLKHERLFKVFGVVCLIIIYGALAIFFADRYYQSKGTGGIFDALYWAVVTITTVGYGDIVPVTPLGKVIGVILMFTGIGIIGVLSGTIASYFLRGYRSERETEDVGEALRILKLRRAKGEVTEEQYQEIKRELEEMLEAKTEVYK